MGDLFRIPMAVTTDATIQAALPGAVVAFSLSGGKDSMAISHAANAYLDTIGHPKADRIGIHADLGRAEWRSTPAAVEAAAARLGVELMTVRRAAGDMVARWEQRFTNALERYENLETYNLIGPWSQADKRFCTSELKAQVIAPALSKRFRGRTIISVVGIRRDESSGRKATPISKAETRYAKPGNRHGTRMLTWHPGAEWSTPEVFACHAKHGLPLHEAYTVYGSTRLSCAFCILGSINDIRAATSAAGNVDLYRHLVAMEATSTFSFQARTWLGDVAPSLLSPGLRADIERAKVDADRRRLVEDGMPADLRYTKGWPPRAPSLEEAAAIGEARRELLERHGRPLRFVQAADVVQRFEQLLGQKAAKEAA